MKKKARKSAPAKKKSAPKSPAKRVKKAKAVARKSAPAKARSVAKKRPIRKAKSAAKVMPTAKATPAKTRTPTMPAPAAPPPTPTLPSSGEGTRENPWVLKTPPGSSEFTACRDDAANPPALVVKVGSTELRYHLRCIEDLHTMLKAHGDWMLLGAADEQQPVVEETVEAWARSPANPVGGWYGLTPGLRGRFATYVPPVLEALGLAEVEHFPSNNRMRAK
jgi:hypothetical protein